VGSDCLVASSYVIIFLGRGALAQELEDIEKESFDVFK